MTPAVPLRVQRKLRRQARAFRPVADEIDRRLEGWRSMIRPGCYWRRNIQSSI